MGIKRYNIPHNTTYLTLHRNESLNKKTMPSRRAKLIDEAIFGLIHYPHYHPNNMQVMVHRPICGFNERPTPPPVEDNFVIGERSSIFHHCHCHLSIIITISCWGQLCYWGEVFHLPSLATTFTL